MRGFNFLIQWSVLCLQDSLLSRTTPIYLKSPTRSTSLSSITMLLGGIIVFRKSMSISLVLSIFKTRWFILHQFTNDVISWTYSLSKSFVISPVSTVSSAYLSTKQESCDGRQSDVYMEKRKGDSTVPWGAPVFVVIEFEQTVGLSLTTCGREDK